MTALLMKQDRLFPLWAICASSIYIKKTKANHGLVILQLLRREADTLPFLTQMTFFSPQTLRSKCVTLKNTLSAGYRIVKFCIFLKTTHSSYIISHCRILRDLFSKTCYERVL